MQPLDFEHVALIKSLPDTYTAKQSNSVTVVVAVLMKYFLELDCKLSNAVVVALCNILNSVTCHSWWVNCFSSSTSRKYKTVQIWIHAMWKIEIHDVA